LSKAAVQAILAFAPAKPPEQVEALPNMAECVVL
jgi:hypothetical protein